MTVLTAPAVHMVLAALAEIKAAIARGLKRAMEARMDQIRSEIEMSRWDRRPPRRERASHVR
jgi:hypothetical protein